jgi:hypothetical protein
VKACEQAPPHAWLRDELRFPPLLALIGAAVALRVATLGLYFPAVSQWADSLRYTRAPGWGGMFGDPWAPAGDPIFLSGLRLISDQLWFTIAAQHLLSLVAGVALYLALRRLEVPRLVALIPTGIFLLSGDGLYLEHTLLSDTLALALTTLALAAAIFGLRPTLDLRWLAAAGAFAAGAWLTRSAFLVVVIVVVATAAIAVPAVESRLRAAGVATAGAACVLALYALAFTLNGQEKYLGLVDMRGWQLYGRVGQFADCSRFDPPADARGLCETAPAGDRGGPQYHLWNLSSPARQSMEIDPETDNAAYEFATRAIVAQPGDYASAVIGDLARYVRDPQPSTRFQSGWGNDANSFGHRDLPIESLVLHDWNGTGGISQVYDGTTVHDPGRGALNAYQDVFRVHGVLIVVLFLFAAAGVLFGRGPRLGILLFGSTSLLLFLLPPTVAGFEFRYGVAPATLLGCAGTLGAYALWLRREGAHALKPEPRSSALRSRRGSRSGSPARPA